MAAVKNQDPQHVSHNMLSRLKSLTLTSSTSTDRKQAELNRVYLEYCKNNKYLEAYTFLSTKLSEAQVAMVMTNRNEPIHWAAFYGNTNLADHIIIAAGVQKMLY